MTQISAKDVPGMGRRQFMNLLTFGSVTGVALGALYPVVNYFIPPKAAGAGGGTTAKDDLGNDVTASGWLADHKRVIAAWSRPQGDPTYLIVDGPDSIGDYGINAICTHLGCVVPWNAGANNSCAYTAPSTTPPARVRAQPPLAGLGPRQRGERQRLREPVV